MYISLLSLHNCDMKLPNFTCPPNWGGCVLKQHIAQGALDFRAWKSLSVGTGMCARTCTDVVVKIFWDANLWRSKTWRLWPVSLVVQQTPHLQNIQNPLLFQDFHGFFLKSLKMALISSISCWLFISLPAMQVANNYCLCCYAFFGKVTSIYLRKFCGFWVKNQCKDARLRKFSWGLFNESKKLESWNT